MHRSGDGDPPHPARYADLAGLRERRGRSDGRSGLKPLGVPGPGDPGEILQLRQVPYILTAQKLGVSRMRIAVRHMFPHVFPQFLTGLILLFPHAILHESGVTFLGFGLPPEQPAIGVILSESMQYLTTGKWWLALFPGLSLVLVVVLFAMAGERVRRLTDPASFHE